MKTSWMYLALMSFLCLSVKTIAQDTFTLQNASFELDEAQYNHTPQYWVNMGSSDETGPDVQPGSYNVKAKAQDGYVYLGLVVRDNNTVEGVGQQLSGWMHKNSTYTFSLYMSQSGTMETMSRLKGGMVPFNAPAVLTIWGVNTKTNQQELLATSNVVNQTQWMVYNFDLKPAKADYDMIKLVAAYAPGFEKQNGNLMIDNCSPIVQVK